MKPRYRYILSGIVGEDEPVSNFRLIAGNHIASRYHGATAIRIAIPDDMTIDTFPGDAYATTDDPRTIGALGYDVLGYHAVKRRWLVINDFKGVHPHAIHLDRDDRFRLSPDEHMAYYGIPHTQTERMT